MLPREKLLELGPEKLTSRELLSILFGHGTKKENVFDCAKRVIKDYGWNIPKNHHPKYLKDQFNISLSHALKLSVSIELGFRWFNNLSATVTLNGVDKVHQYVSDMSKLQKEIFRGLYLNSRYQLIWDETISVGTLSSSTLHPREVFQPAIKVGAVFIIVVHNHPSGNPSPSIEDKLTTNYLLKASEIMHIPIIDHIIIGKNSCFSFQDHDLMYIE